MSEPRPRDPSRKDPQSYRAEHDPIADTMQLELLSALGTSLHAVGMPAHRLETMLEQTATALDVELHVFALPTGLMMSVTDHRLPDPAPTTALLRVAPAVVNLERLARLTAVVRNITSGVLDAEDAKRYVDRVMKSPPRWGWLATVLAYVLSAGSFAVFFGGSFHEIATAVVVGLFVGALSVVATATSMSRLLFELIAAALAAAIANVASLFVTNFVEWIPLASGLIILLPGLSMVDGLDELAHGHLTSGSSRLAGVAAVLLAMTFGAILGGIISVDPPVQMVHPITKLPLQGMDASKDIVSFQQPWWWIVPALLTVAIGSMMRFRARLTDFWPVLVGSAIALIGAKLGAYWLGKSAGPFVAAFLLGMVANSYSWLTRQPPQLLAVPGLALLVPGSFGVRSMASLLTEDTLVGVDTAFQMTITAMALVSGLLISNSFFRERRG